MFLSAWPVCVKIHVKCYIFSTYSARCLGTGSYSILLQIMWKPKSCSALSISVWSHACWLALAVNSRCRTTVQLSMSSLRSQDEQRLLNMEKRLHGQIWFGPCASMTFSQRYKFKPNNVKHFSVLIALETTAGSL